MIRSVRSLGAGVRHATRSPLLALALATTSCVADVATEGELSTEDVAVTSEELSAGETRLLGCLAYPSGRTSSAFQRWITLYSKFTGATIIPNWYRSQHADLAGMNPQQLCDHFRQHGLGERRLATPVFDVRYYLATHADIRRTTGNDPVRARDHWLNSGMRNGRRGSAQFDVKTYLARYPDLQRAFGTDYAAAVRHYLEYGIGEGRSGAP